MSRYPKRPWWWIPSIPDADILKESARIMGRRSQKSCPLSSSRARQLGLASAASKKRTKAAAKKGR